MDIKDRPPVTYLLAALLLAINFLAPLSGSLSLAAAAAPLSAAMLALLAGLRLNRYLLAVIAAAVVIFAFAAGTAVYGVLALSGAVTGIVIHFCAAAETERTRAVIRAAAAAGAVLALSLIIAYLAGGGNLFELPKAIPAYIANNINRAAGDISESFLEMGQATGNTGALSLASSFGDAEQVAVLIQNVTILLPSVFILTCTTFAYLSTAAYIFIRRRLRDMDSLNLGHWRLTVSFPSAMAALAVILLSLFMDEDSGYRFIGVIVNMNFILSPPFFVLGAYWITDKIRASFKDKRPNHFAVAAAAAVMLLLAWSLLELMVSAAVYIGIFSVIHGKYRQFKNSAQ